MEKKQIEETKILLRKAKEFYVLLSQFTRMPYVECDAQTFDDQICLFCKEEDAKKEADRLNSKNQRVQILKIENERFLALYSSLIPLGINALKVSLGQETVTVQLNELVVRPNMDNLPEEKAPIENPEFQLTAIYYMQEYRSNPGQPMEGKIKEMQEEMMAHYQKGRFLIPYKDKGEEKDLLLLKQKDGQAFLPVFSDRGEFAKFQKVHGKEELKVFVAEAKKIPGIALNNATGIAVNPFGVNVQLQVDRSKAV